jgi:septum formation protein
VKPRIILASTSPRRHELLRGLGLEFEVIPSDAEEIHQAGESPETYVRRLSLAKATAVAEKHPDALVLGADTTVHLEGKLLEKPRDPADARGMLAALAGRAHTVFTSVSLVRIRDGFEKSATDTTLVTMSPMTADEIAWYVATGEPMDKAGSYAAQGIGASFVERIEGNFTNVVGLPLPLVRRLLAAAGVHLTASRP